MQVGAEVSWGGEREGGGADERIAHPDDVGGGEEGELLGEGVVVREAGGRGRRTLHQLSS